MHLRTIRSDTTGVNASIPHTHRMNSIDLAGRTAIVTGSGSGIGLARAKRFLESGARVELWGRDLSKLDAALASLQALGPVTRRAVDVSDHAAVAQAALDAQAALGHIDNRFNNAERINKAFDTTKYCDGMIGSIGFSLANPCALSAFVTLFEDCRMKLQGQTAIVTGGARGLGRADALRLASLGADVAIVDLDLDSAGEIEPMGRRGGSAASTSSSTTPAARGAGRAQPCFDVALSQYVTGQAVSVCGRAVLTPN